jgi:protein gp37
MSFQSTIEWTQTTWNAVRGCSKISPGCKHCYAETFAERFRGVLGSPYEQGFNLRLVPEKLIEPFRWQHSRKVFVNSMSDLFHERIPLSYIELVAEVMQGADWHAYQLLTKRAERLEADSQQLDLMLPNLIVGVSVEDQKYGLPRIEHLRRAKVARRFLSIEPLLEDLGDVDFTAIDWVIVGGESGPGARPMNPDWVRRIQRKCQEQNVPFFFKQWGGVQKKKTGRVLDGQTFDAMPEMPLPPPPRTKERRRRLEAFLQRHDGAPVPELLPKLTPIRPHL